jgi:hypothetical protein
VPRTVTGRAFEIGVIGPGEAELFVHPVRIGGVQTPAKARARSAVDSRAHEFLAQSGATGLRQDVEIGKVGERHAVGDRAGEPDHATRQAFVRTDDAPRGGKLAFEIVALAPPPPVGLLRQERPQRVDVDPSGVVVQVVGAVLDEHPPTLSHRCSARVWEFGVHIERTPCTTANNSDARFILCAVDAFRRRLRGDQSADNGPPETVPTSDVRRHLDEAMAAARGEGRKEYADELTSWLRHPSTIERVAELFYEARTGRLWRTAEEIDRIGHIANARAVVGFLMFERPQ